MRRLSLDKQKHDKVWQKNTKFRHSVFHVALVLHLFKLWRLSCGINDSHMLQNRGTSDSRVRHSLRRSEGADVTLAFPAPLSFTAFLCSNHVRQSRCTVDASMWVSAAIWGKDKPAVLSPIILPLVKSSIHWKCLRWWQPRILSYYTHPLRQKESFFDNSYGRNNDINITHSASSFPYILLNVRRRAVHFTSFA